jgi:hypothetical protein
VGRFELDLLRVRFVAQSDRLRLVLLAQAGSGTPTEVAVSEYCLVSLQDSWNRFTRDLVLRSALGNAVTATGRSLPPPGGRPIRQVDAMDQLRRNWPTGGVKPAWWEPRWFNVDDANKAITILRIANSGNVTAAIGSSTNPWNEVRMVRNFVAHRLPSTAREAASVASLVAVNKWRQPRDIILATAPGAFPSDSVYEVWCRRLVAVAHAAVQ